MEASTLAPDPKSIKVLLTGMAKPEGPDAKAKPLAAEALCGAGGDALGLELYQGTVWRKSRAARSHPRPV